MNAPKVLVVEDHESMRQGIGYVLKHEGYEPILCASLEEALAEFRPGKFDALLIDYVLPEGRDGIDIVQKLREQDTRVGIVLFSGLLNADEMRQRSEGLDITHFLTKPFHVRFPESNRDAGTADGQEQRWKQPCLLDAVKDAVEYAQIPQEERQSMAEECEAETMRLRKIRNSFR